MKLKRTLLIFMIIGFLGCKQKTTENQLNEPRIVNFDNELAFNEFNKLNLDDKCVNLLDSKNISESERNSIINSWSNFHKKVSKFLTEENFKWEVSDSTISIYNRIYFDKNGKVKYYVFNINNPSISEEKKVEFEKVLLKYSKDVELAIKRNEMFSQCGKIKYSNY